MYHFYQNNQLLDEQAKIEISLYETFDFNIIPTFMPHTQKVKFTLFNQGKFLAFFYNTEERGAGMLYNMNQFLDLAEDLLLTNVSQAIRLPLNDFWLSVMFDFRDHPIWEKMWPQLDISPPYSEPEVEDGEPEVEDGEEEVEEGEEEDSEWVESGDEDWMSEEVESGDEDWMSEEEESEEDEESEGELEEEWVEYVREKQVETRMKTEQRKARQEEKNAFRLRHNTYRPEERKMECLVCRNGVKRDKKHLEYSKHISAVEAYMSYNKNLDL